MKGMRLKLPSKFINKLTPILIYLLCIGAAVYASRWVAYQTLSLVYSYLAISGSNHCQ